ncbi:MAG: hypothetical protein IPK67_03110 [Planctomycetes bacterium]|nr:hypothetical protein [Planctomycetota bacterium]
MASQADETPGIEDKVKAASVLLRINARAWGVATGAVFGLGLCLATLVLVWKGGSDMGQHLGRLRYVLPGYSVSYAGAALGLVYGFFIGYGLGRLLSPRRELSEEAAPDLGPIHVRLRGGAWGATLGVLLALALFVTTNVLALRGGEHPGVLLSELHVYFPGYRVDFAGSLIGAAYLLALGWLVGQTIAFVYNRSVARAEA